MGHSITAIISSVPAASEIVIKYDLLVFDESGFTIVGLDPAHSDYWKDQLSLSGDIESKIILDCVTTHYFAKQLGFKKYAIIETDYFGGVGDQAAVVYENGKVVLGNKKCVTINEALRFIGVKCVKGYDEFDSIGLSNYRYFYDYFEKYYK